MKVGRYQVLDLLARRCRRPSAGRDSVVVYSPGHLGDILHTVPMLKALRKGKPGSKIIWLVGPWSETLARRYEPLVDEIRIFGPDLPPYTRGKRKWRQGIWHQWRMVMGLRREGVDLFIGFADVVSRFLVNMIVPEQWIGIGDWRPPRVRQEVKTHFQPYEKDRYEADALVGILGKLGIEASASRLDYAVLPGERREAEHFLQAEGVDSTRPLALIAPGSGWSGKNWLPDRFGEVAAWLSGETDFQVAWVGNAEEESLLPEALGTGLNWMGKTSLPLMVAVMARADLFVGNDGGLLHFAAALDVPTVSIWGPTNPGKWGPKGVNHRQLREVDRCEGCKYWDYLESCVHDRRCMKAVGVEDVKSAIDSILPH